MSYMQMSKINTDRKKRSDRLDLGALVYGKIPPQAKDMEESILGAIMIERDAYDTVATILNEESFYVESHQRIFSAIKRLIAKSQPVDIQTVCEELRASEDLEICGGPYYVTKLTNSVVSSANIQAHCRIVMQKHIQREIIRTCGELISEAYNDGIDALEILDEAEQKLSLISQSLSLGEMIRIDTVLVNAMKEIETWRQLNTEDSDGIKITGVPSGYKQVDIATRGWQAGDLIIIAARPSVGKTAFLLNIVKTAATYMRKKNNGSVAVWSLEMRAVRLVLRMMAASSEIWLMKIQTGKLSDAEMKHIFTTAVRVLADLNIYFDEDTGMTIAKMRSRARKLKRKNNLGLIVVDYLQLMTPEERSGTREQEVSKISRNLKNLAQELNVPIIALSQLSREVEKRSDGKPQLSDLRESGSLEQDADMVMFLYNPPEAEIEKAKVEGNLNMLRKKYLRIAKQRDGMLITEELDFNADIQLFKQMDNAFPGLGIGYKPIVIPKDYTETSKPEEDPF